MTTRNIQIKEGVKTEEVELYPMLGGKKKAYIRSKKGEIDLITIDEPFKENVWLNSYSFLKLVRFLADRKFIGTNEVIKVIRKREN